MVTAFLDQGTFCPDFLFVEFPLVEVLDFVVLMRGAIFGSAYDPVPGRAAYARPCIPQISRSARNTARALVRGRRIDLPSARNWQPTQ